MARAELSTENYLLVPTRNTRLWASWVQDKFKLNTRDTVSVGIIKHQVGSGNTRRWQKYCYEIGKSDDIEFKIETGRFPVTRNFLRRVLRDTAIVEASGMFAEKQSVVVADATGEI